MFKRHRSRRDRAIDILTRYLKLKAAGKAVKGAATAVKWTTYGKIARTAVERTPKKGLLVAAGGVGTAAAVAAVHRRRSAAPTTA